jgi:hypothetical protein
MRPALVLWIALSIALSLAALSPLQVAAAEARTATVDANHYDAFWLWAGVKPQPVLDRAKAVYLLRAEVKAEPTTHIVSQLSATPKIHHADVWMVYRVETLRWSPQVYTHLLSELQGWRAAGNRVVGVQIDFDARTRHLHEYAVFLKDLRSRVPAEYKLGITGLLDWSANGDPAGLDALATVVDEVVLQIYQGRRVIPGYQAYLARLDKVRLPFRIGLLQGGEWSAPPILQQHPYFRGYVVFLQNPR